MKDPSIALTGLKHTGKSSIAPRVARALDRSALDLDEEALRLMRVALPRPQAGASLRDYVRHYGIDRFRDFELTALEELLNRRFSGVLACGGGVVDNPGAVRLLTQATTIVYLTCELDILYERILRGGIPPFLDPENPYGSFLEVARRRDAAYRAVADIVVPLDGLTIPKAAQSVTSAIKEREHAR
ncbi:MAG: shikimate kinase [Alkalispirochaetaceae bacterium]